MVKGFLIKNPRARLGGKEGITELQKLPFFSSINWDDLYEKRIEMPYKPKLLGETDISSFETTFTNEKPVDSVPEPDAGGEAGPKKNNKMFGMFSKKDNSVPNSSNGDSKGDADAFKGFSFNKEDSSALSQSNP